MKPFCSYQGSKSKYASQIVDIINPTEKEIVTDFCCGSGAVSLELIKRGAVPLMVDLGMWGAFWENIYRGSQLELFFELLDSLPKDRSKEQEFLITLTNSTNLSIAKWILLQAGSFGGKEVYVEDGRFKHHGFRPHKIYSGRQYHTIYPNPRELRKRVAELIELSDKIIAFRADVTTVMGHGGKLYIDPPYLNSTGYSNSFDIYSLIKKNVKSHNTVYVSESHPLIGADEVYYLDDRKSTNLSVHNKKNKSEVLSVFRE